MRIAKILSVVCILFLFFGLTAFAQKTKKPVPRATPTPARPYVNPIISVAKTQVSNQLHNVNVFVDRFGPIAVVIETADRDAAAGKLRKESQDTNNLNKQKTVAAIRGLRDGLIPLETDFRTKAPLSPYLSKIQGIGALCSQSEDKAIAGQFVAAKDPLRQIVQKLNDTLESMPGIVAGEGYSGPNSTVPVSNTSSGRTIPASTNQGTSRNSEPTVGMTAAEVLQTSWGPPNAKRNSNTSNGNTEVWMYTGNKSVYFFNGEVTNIVK